ncbi:hypothetical protein [Rhizobium sp. CIAT894]|uniref:hypothetical protein n=1 Tax=Rhizobium sp. CIAT894 TaxID=2020312 RepID=UPI0013DD97A2|nr:hypothetical protein [Rhizobium sp. CIAT894]
MADLLVIAMNLHLGGCSSHPFLARPQGGGRSHGTLLGDVELSKKRGVCDPIDF